MGLYPPFIPKEVKIDENEYAYIVNDVREMYIDALEREQVHRYNLIGLYYYQYEDEYNEIINKIFENHMWANFGVVDRFLSCKMCKKPILIKETIPPARRATTAYYNFSRLIFIALSPLCERCKRDPDIVISVIETYCDLKLLDVQKDVIVKWVMENNKKQLEKRIKPGQKLLGYRFEYIP